MTDFGHRESGKSSLRAGLPPSPSPTTAAAAAAAGAAATSAAPPPSAIGATPIPSAGTANTSPKPAPAGAPPPITATPTPTPAPSAFISSSALSGQITRGCRYCPQSRNQPLFQHDRDDLCGAQGNLGLDTWICCA